MQQFKLHRRIPLLRRPFYQRDQALAARAEALAERDHALAARDQVDAERLQAIAERDALQKADNQLNWLRHRPASQVGGQSAVTKSQLADDVELVQRVIAAYRSANLTPLGDTNSFWLQTIADIKQPLHDTLMDGGFESIRQMLQNPSGNELFYGFDTLTGTQAKPHDLGWQDWMRQWTFDNLQRLAEAVGACRLTYPEGAVGPVPDPEDLLRAIDGAFQLSLPFPNPFANEVGLATSRGVASYRAIQAAYQAYRISQLVKDCPAPRILEIGAGLGRTAFYAWHLGIRSYTIIDLPITAVAQGYFLGRTLGAENVSLFGEDRSGVRILPPAAFLDASDRYNLIVNVDSLTEMAHDTARAYCDMIASRADAFLSINHEANTFTAHDICAEVGFPAPIRMAYWMRRGYVDEFFRLSA